MGNRAAIMGELIMKGMVWRSSKEKGNLRYSGPQVQLFCTIFGNSAVQTQPCQS